MKFRLFFSVVTWMILLGSCSREETPGAEQKEEQTGVTLHIGRPESRATGTPVDETIVVSLQGGFVYFTDNSQVTKRVEIVASNPSSDPDKVTATELTTAPGAFIKEVPGSSERVVVVSNLPARVKPLCPVAGAPVSALKEIRLLVEELYASDTDAGVGAVSLYGESAVQLVYPFTYAAVEVYPVASRIEVGKFTATSANILQYTVKGLFLNNYYAAQSMDGTTYTGVTTHHGSDVNQYVDNSPAYGTLKMLYDWIDTPSDSQKEVSPAGTGNVWTYNTFPAKNQAPDSDNLPHLVVVLDDIVMAGGIPLAGKRYLTLSGYRAEDGTSLNQFEKRKVYKISNIEFDENDWDILPERHYVIVPLEVVDWTDAGMDDVESDKQHRLTVDKNAITLYKDGVPGANLEVFTNHPQGWEVKDTDKPSWLTVTPNSGTSGVSYPDVKVSASSIASESSGRGGEFWITAGNLRKKIRVSQLLTSELTIEVTPTRLVFKKSAPAPKDITVVTYPANATVYFGLGGTSPADWLVFPADGPNAGTYSFQPEPNASGSPLNSLVTVYTEDAEGNIAAQTLTILQVIDDLLFEVNTYAPYPAAGGNNRKIEVCSEASWYVAGIGGTPGMITGYDPGEQPFNEHSYLDYFFDLASNPLYEQRSARLQARSTHPDFIDRDIEIVQDCFPAAFTGFDPANQLIELAATPESLRFKVNSGWSFWKGSGFDDVATADAIEGNVQGVTTANAPINGQVTLTPKSGTPVSGITPVAGAELSSSFSLKTENHSPAPQATETIELKYKVPAYFTYQSVSPSTVTSAGGPVSVQVHANTQWGAGLGTLGTASSQLAGVYGTQSTSVSVTSANPSWTTRQIPVELWYMDSEGIRQTVANQAFITQQGYVLNASVNPMSAPWTGEDMVVTFSGDFPAGTRMDARILVADVEHTAASRIGPGTLTLRLKGNSNAPRNVKVQYKDLTNGGAWTTILDTTQQQAPYQLVSNKDNNGSYMWVSPEGDGTYAYAKAYCENPANHMGVAFALPTGFVYDYYLTYQSGLAPIVPYNQSESPWDFQLVWRAESSNGNAYYYKWNMAGDNCTTHTKNIGVYGQATFRCVRSSY